MWTQEWPTDPAREPEARPKCRFNAAQRQILTHLCQLVPEQIDALERALPRIHAQLPRTLPPRLVGSRQASGCSNRLAPSAKHRVVCLLIEALDQALHAGFDAHYGVHSARAYAPRVSASAKSAFLDVVNLCYDAVGFPDVSARKAIDTYRRSMTAAGADVRQRAACGRRGVEPQEIVRLRRVAGT